MRVCRNDTPSFVLKKETSYCLTGLSQRILILPIIATAIGSAAIAATAATAGTTSTGRSGGLAPLFPNDPCVHHATGYDLVTNYAPLRG